MIYQIIYPPFVKTPECILLLHYIGCRHNGDVLQFLWLVLKLICLQKKVLNGHRNHREPPGRVCHGYLQDLAGLALGLHNLQKPTS